MLLLQRASIKTHAKKRDNSIQPSQSAAIQKCLNGGIPSYHIYVQRYATKNEGIVTVERASKTKAGFIRLCDHIVAIECWG